MENICPACGVKIIGSLVKYSYGGMKDKKHLHFKVCQYAKKEGCINDYDGDKKKDPYKFLDF